jgi:hypothetical protein
MCATPPNDLADQIYSDIFKLGTLVSLDLEFPYSLQSVFKDLGLIDIQTFISDNLETPEMVEKTTKAACPRYLDVVRTLVLIYMPLLYGVMKREALIERDELVESLRKVYEGGVTPGVTVLRIVARKA